MPDAVADHWAMPDAQDYVEFAPGVRAHRDWSAWLTGHVGDSFEALFAPRIGESLDKPHLGTRRRVRIEAGGRTAFLKTYTAGGAAGTEWDATFQLAAVDIATMRPVALGRAADGRSLLLTERIPDAGSLESWIRRRIADGCVPGGKAKGRLIEALALLAARLHLAGFVHRDLYLSHIFLRGDGPPWRLHLIDLARVFRPSPVRMARWITKDLAALLYSMPKSAFDETEQATLLKVYGEQYDWKLKGRLPSPAAIWRKVRRIRRHDARRRMGRWPVMLPPPTDPAGPLRIAIFCERFDPSLGGAERSTRQFAERLRRRGHDVTVFTTDAGLPPEGATVVDWGGRRRSAWSRRRLFRIRCAEVAAAGEFHIYHSLGFTESHNVLQPRAGVAAVQRAARHIDAIDLPSLRARHVDASERRAIELTPRPFVTPISRLVADQVRGRYDLPEDRLVPILNGVDLGSLDVADRPAERARLRAQAGAAASDVMFLLVAHDFRLKGVGELMRAAGRMAGEPFRCVVVGRDRSAKYVKLARSLGIADRVRFVGAADPVAPWYASADVLVHPTRYDTCSRVVLEALAVGLPVITTKQNGAAEFLQDGRAGLVVSSAASIEELAAAMIRAMDPGWRATAGAAALALRPVLDIKRHVDEMIALYRRVLEEGSR